MIVFDTSAWIEYFKDTKNAEIVEEYLRKDEVMTPSIVLIELSCKSQIEKWNFEKHQRFIKSKSSILGLTEKMIIVTGINYLEQRKIKPKFGIIDAIILTTAKEYNTKILTKDIDFKGLKEAILLE